MKASLDLLYNLDENDFHNLDTSKLRTFLEQFETDCLSIKVQGGFDAEKISKKWLEEISNQNNHEAINKISLEKIMQIYDLLKQRGSHAANLYQLSIAINVTIQINEQKKIISILQEYKHHLHKIVINDGLNFDTTESVILPENFSDYQLKLKARYDAIKQAYQLAPSAIESGLTAGDKNNIEQCIRMCTNNSPDWSERFFIQKLNAVLNLGEKALHRGVFFTEIPSIKISMTSIPQLHLSY